MRTPRFIGSLQRLSVRVATQALVPVCAIGLLVVGCSDGANGSSEPGGGMGGTATAYIGSTGGGSSSGGAPPILTKMLGAMDTTSFRGIRRVFELQGFDQIVQVEDVGADGTGRFAMELVDAPILPPHVDRMSYDIAFESSARFIWTLRDFRIRDVERATANYGIVVQPVTPMVAGIACTRISFRRHQPVGGRPGHYEVDVDETTGFALAWREFDEIGSVLAEVEYESFAYDGDLSDMQLRGRTFEARPLQLALGLTKQAMFPVYLPALTPPGMQFATAEVQTIPKSHLAGLSAGAESALPVGEWLRSIANDGIEPIVFAHSGNPLQAGGVTPSVVRWNLVGQWGVGYGHIGGVAFVVAGRANFNEIKRLIESAF